MAGAGTQTAAISMLGRSTDNVVATELYDGTSWTVTANATTARRQLAGAGTQPSALVFGGYTSTNVNNTEEFTGATTTARTVKTIDFD